ncbi:MULTISPECIES: hypothetical protein [unclassified Staphylococcus]|uniref:hypothetical protein n=1 Tax=unclassified Staphylococcus TaxID=91994 RepID=UPI0018824380|nr:MULTISPECIES: hypothetical protein [unclassified Staphylococcus]MBF2756378.1 hypothetical protein [Staphylococcus haemolyticus]MBF2773625.1 hypothetical protein [Staphylococcus haemolyticus]MBF2775742.1 hypothetical protein [Staphylococcus haemolyticus]MBF2815311.1 hypothetical protein [Staphylococcus haemolyticus]MBF9719916.1 hypothetical protein [Staphylococcus haemolyticus]
MRFDTNNDGIITRSETNSNPEALDAEHKGHFQPEPDGLPDDPEGYFLTDKQKKIKD